jgi:hypothetical protein
MNQLNELSVCCNKKVVGVFTGAKKSEQGMCTGCGKLLGIKEKRLPYSKNLTKKELNEGFRATF